MPIVIFWWCFCNTWLFYSDKPLDLDDAAMAQIVPGTTESSLFFFMSSFWSSFLKVDFNCFTITSHSLKSLHEPNFKIRKSQRQAGNTLRYYFANAGGSVSTRFMLSQQIYHANKKSSQRFYWKNNHLIIWYCFLDGDLSHTTDVFYFTFSIGSIWPNPQGFFFLLICQSLKIVKMLSQFKLTLAVITMNQICCCTVNIHFR